MTLIGFETAKRDGDAEADDSTSHAQDQISDHVTHTVQFSTTNPGTSAKSTSLLVTTTAPMLNA